MAESRTIVVDWEPPSTLPHVALDSIYPGGFFSRPVPLAGVDHYEVDRYDPEEKLWLSVGNTRTPRVEFSGQDFQFATIRVRVVMRDGSKSSFVSSSTFLIFGMIAEFKNPDSVSLLSFI
jgi:hypothetical protein